MSDAPTSRITRIGLHFVSGDPFWVLVREGIYQRAEQRHVELVPLEIDLWPLSGEQQLAVIEELTALEVGAFMTGGLGPSHIRLMADAGIPIVLVTETEVEHPNVASPRGLYDVARMAAEYIVDRLQGRGRVLIVGGLMEGFDIGHSRLRGFQEVAAAYPDIELHHIPASWLYQPAFEQIREVLAQRDEPLHAIFGLSDSVALAGLHAARECGLIDEETVVVGINGDPLALAAILDGSMAATLETPAVELARHAVDLAVAAAHGQPLPSHFSYSPRLITRDNVAEVSIEKLVTMASLPNRLVGLNRHQEQERLVQLETSLEISRRVGNILDRQDLYHEIVNLIRTNYGYDDAQIFLWSMRAREFVLDKLGTVFDEPVRIPLAESGLLGYTLIRNQPTFIPEMRHSHRFPPDPYWPTTRSRVILPIRQGSAIIGLLDLHSRQPIRHSSNALIGLQALADQMGVVLRNAELYSEAVTMRATAERANQLKTRLLANISHELRTPLNVIEGYSQAALAVPGPYGVELPPALLRDLQHIYTSSVHLERLINDLLDLSKAEVGELELLPEILDPHQVAIDSFDSMAGSRQTAGQVAWRRQLPAALPAIYADPGRLRQILLNLLSNASKFTERGHITLGAQVEADRLHVWVEDTGCGIAPALQERIFEAFSTADQPSSPGQGIGLGLRVTHELVKLHGGTMALASTPGTGSTFHVFLPVLTREGRAALEAPAQTPPPVFPAHPDLLPPHVSDLTRRAVSYFCLHYDQPFRREALAGNLGVTSGYLTHVFRKDLGMTPSEYLTRLRVIRARELLADPAYTITEVAARVGYDDAAYFSRIFLKETGHSPRAYRQITQPRAIVSNSPK